MAPFGENRILGRLQRLDLERWTRTVRVFYWIIGVLGGGILTYTTRYFLNSDGINYIELGEAFNTGGWAGLVNLTASPGYGFLLGVSESLLGTNRLNELTLLKIPNFLCFLMALAACEIFLRQVGRYLERSEQGDEKFLAFPLILALTYGMFLVSALTWIKVRTVAPELVVFTVVLLGMALILRIREDPSGYVNSALLGLVLGLGYLTKTFFLPFSAVFLVLAGWSTGSLKKAVTRIPTAVLIIIVVAAPLIVSLSEKAGRFSYGEAGNYNYAYFVASKGEPIHPPKEINQRPRVLFYGNGPSSTYPAGFDVAFWKLGVKPVFDLTAQLRVFAENVRLIFDQSPGLFALIFLWLVIQLTIGRPRIGPFSRPSIVLLLGVPAVAGICLFCLVVVEIRYAAPFIFLGFVAAVLCWKYDMSNEKVAVTAIISAVIVAAGLTLFWASTVVDESIRGLHSSTGKLSYRDRHVEDIQLKSFLEKQGLTAGDFVAIVGQPRIYWARMAGLKIMARVPDEGQFLSSGITARSTALGSLKKVGVKALVGMGSAFANLSGEGWARTPGTRDYFVLMLP